MMFFTMVGGGWRELKLLYDVGHVMQALVTNSDGALPERGDLY